MGTRDIKGELFALKANVHQLGGSTHGDTAAEEGDHGNWFRGSSSADPRESSNVYFNVVLAREIVALWADYMQLITRKGNIKKLL